MWIWILQLLGFDPRGIFRFYDGRRYRRVDPMVAARRLWSATVTQLPMPGMNGQNMVLPDLPFNLDELKADIASGDRGKFSRACQIGSTVAQTVFEVTPLENGGLTELECVELLGRFSDYLGDVKKNSSGSPISPLFTGFPASGLPTSSSLDSGSTLSDNISDSLE